MKSFYENSHDIFLKNKATRIEALDFYWDIYQKLNEIFDGIIEFWKDVPVIKTLDWKLVALDSNHVVALSRAINQSVSCLLLETRTDFEYINNINIWGNYVYRSVLLDINNSGKFIFKDNNIYFDDSHWLDFIDPYLVADYLTGNPFEIMRNVMLKKAGRENEIKDKSAHFKKILLEKFWTVYSDDNMQYSFKKFKS